MTVVTSAFSKSSVFAVHTNAFLNLSGERFPKVPLSVFENIVSCGRKAKSDKKRCVFKFIRISVDGT